MSLLGRFNFKLNGSIDGTTSQFKRLLVSRAARFQSFFIQTIYWSLNSCVDEEKISSNENLNHLIFLIPASFSCVLAHTLFSLINILKVFFPSFMWFILCRALKQLSAEMGIPKKQQKSEQLCLMFIFGVHTKKTSLQKLSAACRWLFFIARFSLFRKLQSGNLPATNNVFKSWTGGKHKKSRVFRQINPPSLHDLNHYFMCSSIYPRAHWMHSSTCMSESNMQKNTKTSRNVCHINSHLAYC